jgi:hypothetical protein
VPPAVGLREEPGRRGLDGQRADLGAVDDVVGTLRGREDREQRAGVDVLDHRAAGVVARPHEARTDDARSREQRQHGQDRRVTSPRDAHRPKTTERLTEEVDVVDRRHASSSARRAPDLSDVHRSALRARQNRRS